MINKNSYQHMVLDYYVDRLKSIHEKRRERILKLKDRKGAENYRNEIRRKINRAFGVLPKRTPLNATTVKVINVTSYRIENVIFESRPGFVVSANLYVPNSISAQAPAVLGCCGHAIEGKAYELYQGFAQALVQHGFVVLVYDPIDQGERDQYLGLSKDERPRGMCHAHNTIGKQMELVGEFFGTWRVWDGIRAHDYLRSREEVDPSRICVTGNSGGGTLTTYLWALDSRFAAAAPSCFVNTFIRNLTNEEPADCEQCPPDILHFGCDHADLLIAAAPKPILLLGQKYDFFDLRGLQEAYSDISRISHLLGARRNDVQLFIGPTTHGYTEHNRAAMVGFFARHMGMATKKNIAIKPIKRSTLNATKSGQVVSEGSIRTYEIIKKQATRISQKRKDPSKKDLPRLLRKLLQIPAVKGIPDYRILKPFQLKGADSSSIARFGVETEPGIVVILKKVTEKPPTQIDPSSRVRLWIPHIDSLKDIESDPLAQSLLRSGDVFFLDVRGIGESMPVCVKGGFLHPYDWDYMFHAHGLMLGESYMGRRIFDLLRTMDLLCSEGVQHIDLFGRGLGSLISLFAACLHPNVRSITVKNSISSYRSLTERAWTPWPSSVFVRNLLKHFDLSDCHDYLGKRLKSLDPWGSDPSKQQFPGSDLST
jgi:cephalosporin-C deacetylase-like acetyl esterase